MTRQLLLIPEDAENDWHLDEHTKEMGRQGLADARKALVEAQRRAAA
jgi:hypothetical protein